MITQDQIRARVKELPALPTTIGALSQAVEDERCTVDRIQAILSRDPALSASVLRLSNSAGLSGGNKVSDLRAAILRLGFDAILNLGRTAAIIRNFKEGHNLDALLLWQHSVAVALTAKGLCKLLRMEWKGESAFLAGLLHDIGKLALDYCFTEEYTPVVAAWRAGESLVEAEKRLLGLTHAEVGATVAETWNFPEELAQGIGRHHCPQGDDFMGNLLALSDLMVRTRIPNGPFDETLMVNLQEEPSFIALFKPTQDLDIERLTFSIDDELDHAIGFVQLAFQE